MSFIAIITIGLLVAALVAVRTFYVEKLRSAERLDEHRRAELQELQDKNKALLSTLRAIALQVKDKPHTDPVRTLARQHVYEPGLSYWQEQNQ